MWQKVWWYIKDSFDTLIALMIAVTTGVAGLVGWGDNSHVLAAIATTLGVLAISLTRDRIQREHLIRETVHISNNLESILQNHATSAYFFTKRSKLPNLSNRLEKVSRLDVMGASLHTFSVNQRGILKDIKDAGGKVRILVTNPDNEQLQYLMAMTFFEVDTPDSHILQIRTALSSMVPLVGTSAKGGQIEVRLTNQLPFGYLALDSHKSHGEIQVELYLRGPKYNNPIFILQTEKDTNWYNVYQNQFEELWNHAIEVSPPQGR